LSGEALESVVHERLAGIERIIVASARRVGRDPATVRVVAVTKTFPAAAVSAALAAGLSHIGENYVQEARTKRSAVGEKAAEKAIWHLIGGLQRNKVRTAVAWFDRIDTVDSVELAEALASEAARVGHQLPVLLQVNVVGERTKRGARPDDLEGLARAVLANSALVLEGLMTIPPEAADPEASRPHFRRVCELRNDVSKRLGVELPHLSMGMSNDFAVAVEEGATFVRLGRALFGARGTDLRSHGSSAGGEGS
jgi:pyridoxal phosphate enzyme (YggS family)